METELSHPVMRIKSPLEQSHLDIETAQTWFIQLSYIQLTPSAVPTPWSQESILYVCLRTDSYAEYVV